jgi:hypothetical protein
MHCIIYAFPQFGIGQQLAGRQPDGLQSAGLQLCCVLCLFFLTFFAFLLLAKAPVAKEQTIASTNIFFIMLF